METAWEYQWACTAAVAGSALQTHWSSSDYLEHVGVRAMKVVAITVSITGLTFALLVI